MRSKWSRVLRHAAEFKSPDERLGDFIKRKGGINECAARFGRRPGRGRAHRAAAYASGETAAPNDTLGNR